MIVDRAHHFPLNCFSVGRRHGSGGTFHGYKSDLKCSVKRAFNWQQQFTNPQTFMTQVMIMTLEIIIFSRHWIMLYLLVCQIQFYATPTTLSGLCWWWMVIIIFSNSNLTFLSHSNCRGELLGICYSKKLSINDLSERH